MPVLPHRRQMMSPSRLCFLAVFIFLLSCSDDDGVNQQNCLPLNLKTTFWSIFDSVAFEYKSTRMLDRILLYKDDALMQTNQLSYDGENKLIRYTQTLTGSVEPYEIYDIIYDSNGKPDYINIQEPFTGIPPSDITFTHDNDGRLITKEDSKTRYTWRYQYDDQDNVSKVFYKNALTPNEVLGRENHAFDNHPRFFANSPELSFVAIYILGFEPSQNNVMNATLYWGNPGFREPSPRPITHTLAYDNNGLVSSNANNGAPVQGEFYYNSVTYDCQP